MKTATTFIAGTAICLLSIFAAQCLPGWAWHCGWAGACIYELVMGVRRNRPAAAPATPRMLYK